MKPSWRQLGPIKRHMEPINRDMEPIWHQLGVNLGRLGAALVHLVPNLAWISVQSGHSYHEAFGLPDEKTVMVEKKQQVVPSTSHVLH